MGEPRKEFQNPTSPGKNHNFPTSAPGRVFVKVPTTLQRPTQILFFSAAFPAFSSLAVNLHTMTLRGQTPYLDPYRNGSLIKS